MFDMNIFSNKYIWLLGGLLSISVQGMGQEEINHLTGTLVSDTQDNPGVYRSTCYRSFK